MSHAAQRGSNAQSTAAPRSSVRSEPVQGDQQDYRDAVRDHSDDHRRCRNALSNVGGQLRRLEGGPHLNERTRTIMTVPQKQLWKFVDLLWDVIRSGPFE